MFKNSTNPIDIVGNEGYNEQNSFILRVEKLKVANAYIELIGKTPLLRLNRLEKQNGFNANLVVKIESFNPMGSVKDRTANALIEDGFKRGYINENTTIIEPTSGNTGIGLAFSCAVNGLKLILTMPDSMSIERRKIVYALGAEVVLTPGMYGMKGAIRKAEELNKEIENSYIPHQFENDANSEIHYRTTGPEIYDDLDGNVDYFVSAVGTGGTITGVGKYLKERNKGVKVVAVEPASSAVLSGEAPGPHRIQGIGAGFIPDVLDTSIYDEIIKVTNDDAYEMTRLIAKTEGLFVGASSGAALKAMIEIAKREEAKGKTIVALLPDTGERYLSTNLFISK